MFNRWFAIAVAMCPLTVAACSDDEPSRDGGVQDAGLRDGGPDGSVALERPYEPWSLMQTALRQSPDHRLARAESLVAARDAQGLFTFVRDEIALLPLPPGAVVNAATALRFGPRATLRSGAGTFRDRAQLLADLLHRAGIDARVVVGTPGPALTDPAAVRRAFLRNPSAAFDPPGPPPGYASWSAVVGGEPPPDPVLLDPSGAEARALAEALLSALPAGLAAPEVALEMPSVVPLVRADIGGESVLMNPIRVDAQMGEGDVGPVSEAPDADPLPEVEAVVEIVRSDDPLRRIEVLRGRYALDELLGRQLLVRFAPPESFETWFGRPLDAVRAFLPVLAIMGADRTAEESAADATLGTAFTRDGDLLATNEQGELTVNGVPFVEGDPGRAVDARSLELVVSSTAGFPNVELTMAVKDGDGDPVVGLPATVFRVEENGELRPALLRTTSAQAPRVLFLLDLSLSQPTSLTDADARRVLGRVLGAAVLDAAPDATVQVAALGGIAPLLGGYEALDATTIGERFSSRVGTGSSIYGGLSSGLESGPNLIILLTDGLSYEDPEDIARRRGALLGGAPVVAVGCATSTPTIDRAHLRQIASMTGGTFVDAGDLSSDVALTSAISDVLTRSAAAPYRLSYRAPVEGPSSRVARVSVGPASGSFSYSAPMPSGTQRAVTGVLLTLSHRGEFVTRWLAGGPRADDAFEAARAVDGLLLGNAMVSFEASAPSASIVLDELVTARLATEPLYQAAVAGDGPGIIAAYERAWPALPWLLGPLQQELLAPSDGVIRESAFRAVLITMSLGGGSLERADILPFTRFETLGAGSPTAAFNETLAASLRLALAEAKLFPESTKSALAGKTLRNLAPGNIGEADLPPVAPEERARFVELLNAWPGHHRLVADDGSSLSFWAVHPSGSAIGVLPDGSGGGAGASCGPAQDLGNYYETLTLLLRILGLPEYGVIQVLGKFVAVTAAKAALCLAGGPVPPWVTDPNAGVQLVCDLARSVVGDIIGEAWLPNITVGGANVLKGIVTDGLGDAAVSTRCPPPPSGGCP